MYAVAFYSTLRLFRQILELIFQKEAYTMPLLQD